MCRWYGRAHAARRAGAGARRRRVARRLEPAARARARHRGGARGDLRGLVFGAVIAAVIAGYTVVDRYGIHHAAAAPYLLLVMLGPALAYPLAVGRRRVRAAVGPATIAVGAASASAYLLALF